MDFIIKDKDGNEYGPINQDALIKWTTEGRVRPDTPVRNALLHSWKAAADLAFLRDFLENQPPEEKEGFVDGLLHSKKETSKPEEKKTAFEYRHLPDPATAELRIAAFLCDLLPLLLIGSIVFALGYFEIEKSVIKDIPPEQAADVQQKAVQENKGKISEDEIKKLPMKDNFEAESPPSPSEDITKGYKPGSKWVDQLSKKKYSCLASGENSAEWVDNEKVNSIFYFYFTVFLFFALLYYGIALGTFAQTFGMWFFGIFIVRNDKELSEVLHFRAFLFTVLMFVFGILAPIMVSLPGRSALHDILTGVRVLKIAGKPKA